MIGKPVLIVAGIPAYNEEKNIQQVIKKTSKFVNEVVVCDDGSEDNTSFVAKKSGAIVLKHEQNLGKGLALKSLFNYAKKVDADILITIDGDGQFLPEEIPSLISSITDQNYDLVNGYRFDNANEMPKYRKMGNKFFDKMTSLAVEGSLRDTQSGFRAYSKKAINSIHFSNKSFGADSEILIDASKKGLKISEKKVSVIYNTGGKTSTSNPISHGGDIFGSLIEQIAIRHPLKYLGVPGFILLIIGITYSGVVISIFNEARYFSIPSTLVALGCLVIGLILVMMAVILFSIDRASNR